MGGENQTLALTLREDASSIFAAKGSRRIDITLRRASEFLQENPIDQIDLMKINIEGGEYDPLDHLIETGLIKRISNILVQFHDFVPNAECRMKQIRKRLVAKDFLSLLYQ